MRSGAIKMNNGGKFTVIHGGGGIRGPQGPLKPPTLHQFLNALRQSDLRPIRKLALVYHPRSSLSQIKNMRAIKDDVKIVGQITREILRRKLVTIEDLSAYALSPDTRERFLAAGCEKLELNLTVDLMLDKEERVSGSAEGSFYHRALSEAEIEDLSRHPEEKIKEALREHDSYLERDDGPELALPEVMREAARNEDPAEPRQALSGEMGLSNDPLILMHSDSSVEQTAAVGYLWKICLKPKKTARDYWLLLDALQETSRLTLALVITSRIHDELFT
jgi:hypothetical protein